MAHGHRRRLDRAAALAVAASLFALLPLFVAPALAVTCGNTVVDNGHVSPGSGTTSTNFQFSVRYDRLTNAPNGEVQFQIDGGGWNPMATNVPPNTTVTASTSAAAGSHSYAFRARRMGGNWCTLTSVDPGSFTVTAPTPKPTPKPTPRADAQADPETDRQAGQGDREAHPEADAQAGGRGSQADAEVDSDRQAERHDHRGGRDPRTLAVRDDAGRGRPGRPPDAIRPEQGAAADRIGVNGRCRDDGRWLR